MFADPQTITIISTPYTLPRIGSGPSNAVYRETDDLMTLNLSHATNKRTRHVARLDVRKTAPDPLQPAVNKPFSMSAYLVVDVPLFGFVVADQKSYVAGLTTWLTTSSGANLTKLLGGES